MKIILHTFSCSVSKNWTITYPETVKGLNFNELDHRMARRTNRVVAGRSDEMVVYEVEKVPLTTYTQKSAWDDTRIRYVSKPTLI